MSTIKAQVAVKAGDLIRVSYEDKPFEVIVIDPNGLGKGQPSIGFGFRMMEKNAGIDHSTLSRWVVQIDGSTALQLPSGMCLRVMQISGSNGNQYSVVEASDWMTLALDVLQHPGKTSKATKEKLFSFIRWFAVKGFYAEVYTAFKGKYTARDSRATTTWLNARSDGIVIRKAYTDLLKIWDCDDYAHWTNVIYVGLFGITAQQMKVQWELVDGSGRIARNYIQKERQLKAVSLCEELVVKLMVDSIGEAHRTAIAHVKRKLDSGRLV